MPAVELGRDRSDFVGYSLKRLASTTSTSIVPAVSIPTSRSRTHVGTIGELVKAGYVRAIGLSEVGQETIHRAHAVHSISDLQIEYSLVSRSPQTRIFPLLSELGIGVTAYGVLSRGLLSGSKPKSARDFRAHLPRFSGANLQRNERLVETLRRSTPWATRSCSDLTSQGDRRTCSSAETMTTPK